MRIRLFKNCGYSVQNVFCIECIAPQWITYLSVLYSIHTVKECMTELDPTINKCPICREDIFTIDTRLIDSPVYPTDMKISYNFR